MLDSRCGRHTLVRISSGAYWLRFFFFWILELVWCVSSEKLFVESDRLGYDAVSLTRRSGRFEGS